MGMAGKSLHVHVWCVYLPSLPISMPIWATDSELLELIHIGRQFVGDAWLRPTVTAWKTFFFCCCGELNGHKKRASFIEATDSLPSMGKSFAQHGVLSLTRMGYITYYIYTYRGCITQSTSQPFVYTNVLPATKKTLFLSQFVLNVCADKVIPLDISLTVYIVTCMQVDVYDENRRYVVLIYQSYYLGICAEREIEKERKCTLCICWLAFSTCSQCTPVDVM